MPLSINQLIRTKNQKKVINIAHRGASAQFPENTMPAFQGAINQQADMIELDVQLTKDGVPVVFHDDSLHRLIGKWGAVKNYPFKEVQSFDAGAWFSQEFSELKIPTLDEVLTLAREKIFLNIEIKANAVSDEVTNGVEQKCYQLLQKYNMQDQALMSSFDTRVLPRLRTMNPNLPLGMLYTRRLGIGHTPAQLMNHYHATTFHCSRRLLNDKIIENLTTHNLPLFVYTINDEDEMEKLILKGVKGIFTNKPFLLHKTSVKMLK